MTSRTFADQLEQVAADIGNADRADLAVLLRRAAIRLRARDAGLDVETDAALAKFASEFGIAKDEALSRVVQEALTAMGYLTPTVGGDG